MNRRMFFVMLLGASLAGAALYRSGLAGQGAGASAAKAVPPAETAAGKVILANVRLYTEAFNRQDTAKILELFTEECDIIESDGTRLRGRKELEAALKEAFADEPSAKIGVEIESLSFITPTVAVEEGKTTHYPDGKTLTAESEYQVTHVHDGKRWLMSHVRVFNREALSPYDRLRDLEALVGDWVDEGGESLIESSYRWDTNKSFLLQDFSVRVRGKVSLTGTQRIGWDPLTKRIKAWVFDSEGGHGTSEWTPVEDGWVIHISAVRADGKSVTATNQITHLSKDRMHFESAERLVDGERMPGFETYVVRKPPAPK